jgi:hypothetical protein
MTAGWVRNTNSDRHFDVGVANVCRHVHQACSVPASSSVTHRCTTRRLVGPILRLSRDAVVAGSRSGQSYPDGGGRSWPSCRALAIRFTRRGGAMSVAAHRREVLPCSKAVAVGAHHTGEVQ